MRDAPLLHSHCHTLFFEEGSGSDEDSGVRYRVEDYYGSGGMKLSIAGNCSNSSDRTDWCVIIWPGRRSRVTSVAPADTRSGRDVGSPDLYATSQGLVWLLPVLHPLSARVAC